jgi:predicted ATP-binding protein involved in virulence
MKIDAANILAMVAYIAYRCVLLNGHLGENLKALTDGNR